MNTKATAVHMDNSINKSSDMVGGRVMERICELCVKNLLSNKATMFCSACSESLCDRCISIHIKDTSKRHVIMDARYKGLDSHGVDMNGLDMCNEHSKIIEFYCECHKELCCRKCVMVHRKCDNFIEIVVCTEQDRIQIRDVKASVLKADVDTFFLVQKVNQVKASLKDSNEAMSKAIDTTRDNILKVYDDAKCKLFAEVDAIKAEKKKTLKKMNNILLSVRADIAKALPVFSNVLEKGTPQQIFIFSRRSAEILNAVDQQLRLNPNLNPLLEMHVNFAGDIANFIHAGDNLMKLNIGKEVIDKGKTHILFAYLIAYVNYIYRLHFDLKSTAAWNLLITFILIILGLSSNIVLSLQKYGYCCGS
ncbi:hypothetical protein DPMN_081915 [Dreissena polymorpha]|uniref:B box-type domain-containing protein n=1 Tax=Dreissena polymorpha TaxID=45954 RepID=A0A9D3Y6R5_DREPO|nr:hypothetical protein DPMN_081915 [Dreissena polymorpha]